MKNQGLSSGIVARTGKTRDTTTFWTKLGSWREEVHVDTVYTIVHHATSEPRCVINGLSPTTELAYRPLHQRATGDKVWGAATCLDCRGYTMSIRVPVLVAAAIVIWAAIITVDPVSHPLGNVHFYSGVVLAAAVAIQRVNGVQSWLAKPRNSRTAQIELFVQQTLLNLCIGRTVNRDLADLCIHVWEVPLWYRRALPQCQRLSGETVES